MNNSKFHIVPRSTFSTTSNWQSDQYYYYYYYYYYYNYYNYNTTTTITNPINLLQRPLGVSESSLFALENYLYCLNQTNALYFWQPKRRTILER